MRTWLKSPLAILAPDDGSDCAGGIVVEGPVISECVTAGAEPVLPVDHIFDASRHVVIPALINTHHHFYQTLTRAHPDAINKELFPWLQALYPLWARFLDREAFQLATRLALAELLMSGCGTVADHHYVYPGELDDAMDIQAEEAAKFAMRITLNRGSMNLSQKDGGLPPDNLVQCADTILADCERVAKTFHDPTTGAMVQVAFAPCSPFSVTPELMRDTAILAKSCGCRLHTHLGETHDENQFCEERFGCRPLDYLERAGWLGADTWLAHGIHFNDAEVKRIGAAGTGICHCPTSNMVLASGPCRSLELERAGAPVGLGVDGSASNDSSNLMEGVRHALMINRLTYGAAAVSHFDALRWATTGSARCLGRTDIGEIATGKQADLALFLLDELRFSGAGDPLAALVLCGAHRADRVMIGGNWRLTDGVPVGIDIERLRHQHGEAAKAFLEAV